MFLVDFSFLLVKLMVAKFNILIYLLFNKYFIRFRYFFIIRSACDSTFKLEVR
jgi:hypothetical protein